MITVKRALISVSDKQGIAEFASGLNELGVEIISTGGTFTLLREKGIPVTAVSDVTGFPEILDGRVKTLTPQVHAGILFRRDLTEHRQQIEELGIGPIDLVVVNLYPFEATVSRPGVAFEEAIENIDIGGPAMLRSAAKNFSGVAVVCDPTDYGPVLEALRGGGLNATFTYSLARKVFSHTAAYDAAIATYLGGVSVDGRPEPPADFLTDRITLHLRRRQELRYGENPHQRAAVYESPGWIPQGVVQAEVLQGKALSFNNYLDLDSAWSIVSDFDDTAVTIIKHTNPCGAAVGASPEEAYRKALESDPISAYGGVVGCNREVTEAMAEAMAELFLEAVVAPSFHPAALALLAKRKNLRVLRLPNVPRNAARPQPDLRTIAGGFLLQERDTADALFPESMTVVTRRKPTEHEYQGMIFGWSIVRHLKSNAVLFAGPDRMLSMGSGQTSRVESVRLAQAKSRLLLAGSVLASDAFFPFRDGLDVAAEAGATAFIQPGGSIRDDEVIAAANERELTMVFTGRRHFKH